MKFIASLLIAITMAGCSSSLVRVGDATPVHANYPAPAPEKPAGTVVFVRDAGFSGSMNDFIVIVDGQRIGTLRPGQKITLRMAAGSHIVGVGCSPCSDDYRKEIQHQVEAGKTSVFRLNFDSGLNIQPSSQLD